MTGAQPLGAGSPAGRGPRLPGSAARAADQRVGVSASAGAAPSRAQRGFLPRRGTEHRARRSQFVHTCLCLFKECSKKTKTDDPENASAGAPSPAQDRGQASTLFHLAPAVSAGGAGGRWVSPGGVWGAGGGAPVPALVLALRQGAELVCTGATGAPRWPSKGRHNLRPVLVYLLR